jgi:molybdate transport system ATP-binding protein
VIDVRLYKTFRDADAPFCLDVDFSIGADNKTVALFGPSGSGKSLTLHCLAGLVRPDKGRISLNGQVLYDGADAVFTPARRRRIGYMFQDYALFPHLNVLQNVAYARSGCFARHLRREEKEQAQGMLDRFAIGHLARQMPGRLSGGQRQRVALVRALNAEPELLLLDEPFSALDTLLRERLREELLELFAALTIPVIIITHDPDDVDAFAAAVILFDHGNAHPVPEYMALRAGFASAGRCLRHLQQTFASRNESVPSPRG